ncbi:reverse transcriptase domain-containing protein [Tanacetum coccineum]
MAIVTALVNERPVVIFSKSSCCMCYTIKKLISSFGANATVYELDEHPEGKQIEKELRGLGCKPSVPAVFIGEKLIGGANEIMSLHLKGQLVQTQVESDVAMDRRRHRNRADAQLVLILEDKPDTVPYRQDQTLTLTPEFGLGGHTRGETNACSSVCRMRGPTPEPTTPNQSPSLQDYHVSSLETLIKQHNEKCGTLITPIRLTFGEEVDTNSGKDKEKGAAGVDDELKRPYKEVLESPFTRRIIEFSAPSHRMPTNLRVYDGSTDPDDHISRFVGAANQGEWEMRVWCRMFQQTLDGPARGWFDRMPNGLTVGPTSARAFMSNSKCPELARRFADQVLQTGYRNDEASRRFHQEAFKSTELPKGEQPKKGPGAPYKGFRPPRTIHGGGPPRGEGYNAHNRTDHYLPYVPPRQTGQRYENRRFEHRRQEVNQLSLESLVKRPKEILATELQLQLPPPSPQLEIALESGKLNHLVKDVRQRGGNRGRQGGNGSTHGRIINMVYEVGKNQKRKCQGGWEEDWMSAPITFPSIPSDDVSDEPLIVEAEIEGYLVRRVFVDQGAAVQVMFEHCFRNLCPTIQARLSRTHTELVGFSGEQLQPMGKIELEVVFGNEGLSRRAMMKFTVVEASSPYNIILGRTGMRELRAVSSTTHAMMKFPTPRGIATLVPRRDAIFECRQIEVRQAFPGESPEEKPGEQKKEGPTEDVMINPAFPDQKITIGTQFSRACRNQLVELLKNSSDVFAWQPSDMVGIPRRISQHTLNVNPSVTPVAQKRRILGQEKSKVVMKEVAEWLRAGIVRPVRYPTWISNPVLVKKIDDTWRMYAYKGYHQIQMSEEDEEKTAFYTDQGTFCYTKMPFGLKNVGATYQRLVDSAFQTQMGRNLEAYVDDMVIKSRTEKDMIMDVMETFDNLGKINMKLNPKKCSFGVKEGKFLGYMVTSEGIRANPKKTKAVADMQSPKTLREMQSLSGKLAALNRFLSRSAERAMPFFDTLKNITKENKDDFRWTKAAEQAF